MHARGAQFHRGSPGWSFGCVPREAEGVAFNSKFHSVVCVIYFCVPCCEGVVPEQEVVRQSWEDDERAFASVLFR